MSNSHARLFVILVLSAAIVSLSFGGQKLRYQMSKGSTYKYLIVQDAKTTAQMMGQEFKTTMIAKLWLSLLVEGVGKDGEFICVGKVDTAILSIDSPMLKDTAFVPSEFFGKRVKVILSPIGKTLNVTTIDSVAPSPKMQMLGGLNLKNFFSKILLELPEQEIAVGGSWKVSDADTVDARGIQIITKPNTECKIVGTEKIGESECYKIAIEGTATQYGSGAMQGMEIVMDGNTKSKGSAFFAPKVGRLVEVEQTNSVETTVSGTGEQTFTQTASREEKITFKLID